MNNLIYQFYNHIPDPKVTPDFVKMSRECFSKYASIHGAEYMLEQSDRFSSFPPITVMYSWTRFLDEKYDIYDKILYADTDILVENYEENIFDECGGDDILGLVPLRDSMSSQRMILHKYGFFDAFEKSISYLSQERQEEAWENTQNTIWPNAGLILMTREFRQLAREKFLPWEEHFKNCNVENPPNIPLLGDEPYIMFETLKNNIRFKVLEMKWNYRYFGKRKHPDLHKEFYDKKSTGKLECNFIHFLSEAQEELPYYFNKFIKDK